MNLVQQSYEDEFFQDVGWPGSDLTDREFSGCKFNNCNFSDYRFVRASFADCVFDNCNLSNIEIDGCRFQSVIFLNCKIMGIAFAKISPFLLSWEFRQCRVQLCNFSGLRLMKSRFIESSVRETDFINVDLKEASFSRSDLQGSKFHNANLEKADFTGAKNYFIDPAGNRLKNATFSHPEVLTLLAQFGIKIEY